MTEYVALSSNEEIQDDTVIGLPLDLWRAILSYLPVLDLCRCTQVCRSWAYLVASLDRTAWKRFYFLSNQWKHPNWPRSVSDADVLLPWRVLYRSHVLHTRQWQSPRAGLWQAGGARVTLDQHCLRPLKLATGGNWLGNQPREILVGPNRNHTSLQNALCVAQEYDTIRLDPGFYDEQFEMSSKIPLEITGNGEVGSVTLSMCIEQNSPTARLCNLTLRAPWFTPNVIKVSSGHLQIDNCTIEDGHISVLHPASVHMRYCTLRRTELYFSHVTSSVVSNCELIQSTVCVEGWPKETVSWATEHLSSIRGKVIEPSALVPDRYYPEYKLRYRHQSSGVISTDISTQTSSETSHFLLNKSDQDSIGVASISCDSRSNYSSSSFPSSSGGQSGTLCTGSRSSSFRSHDAESNDGDQCNDLLLIDSIPRSKGLSRIVTKTDVCVDLLTNHEEGLVHHNNADNEVQNHHETITALSNVESPLTTQLFVSKDTTDEGSDTVVVEDNTQPCLESSSERSRLSRCDSGSLRQQVTTQPSTSQNPPKISLDTTQQTSLNSKTASVNTSQNAIDCTQYHDNIDTTSPLGIGQNSSLDNIATHDIPSRQCQKHRNTLELMKQEGETSHLNNNSRCSIACSNSVLSTSHSYSKVIRAHDIDAHHRPNSDTLPGQDDLEGTRSEGSDCSGDEEPRGEKVIEEHGHGSSRLSPKWAGEEKSLQGEAFITSYRDVLQSDPHLVNIIRSTKGPLIQHCLIHHGSAGIKVCEEGQCTVYECEMKDLQYAIRAVQNSVICLVGCTLHHTHTSAVYLRLSAHGLLLGNDIYCTNEAGIDIRRNADPIIQCNRIHHSKRSGIAVLSSGYGVIRGNDIYQNREAGICVLYKGDPYIIANRIHRGGASGVNVSEGGLGYVLDNHISNNRWGGVDIRAGANPKVSGNTICNGLSDGVVVGPRGRGLIEGNTVIGNEGCGVWVRGGHPTLRLNQIYNNNSVGISLTPAQRGVGLDNDSLTESSDGEASMTSGLPSYSDYTDQSQTAVVQVLHNTVFHNNGYGVQCCSSSLVCLYGNALHDNKDSGVWIKQEEVVEVVDNSITSNRGSGVVVAEGAKAQLQGNGIDENHRPGVVVTEGQCDVTQNDIMSKLGPAILLCHGAEVMISENRLHSAVTAAVQCAGSEINATVSDNTIYYSCETVEDVIKSDSHAKNTVKIEDNLMKNLNSQNGDAVHQVELYLDSPPARPNLTPPQPLTQHPPPHSRVAVVTRVVVPPEIACQNNSKMCHLL